MNKLEIGASKDLILQYHSLLKSEWKFESISSALKLARHVVANAGCPLQFSWEKRDGRDNTFVVGAEILEHLRDFMLSFYVEKSPQAVPKLPVQREKKFASLSRNAEELSVLLNFQYLAKAHFQTTVDDTSGFFKNCQSLLATLGIHFLLPELKSRKLHQEARFTSYATALHIAQIWHDDFPHQAYLSGMLSEFLGAGNETQRALEYAFATVSPQEHGYLTTAHVLWYHYLDAGCFEAARDFVLSLYRLSPKEHLDEIQEMINDTYAALEA